MVNEFNKHLEEEEKNSLIIEVLIDTLAEYNLKKMPTDDSLNACLNVYTKRHLLKLARKNGIDVKESWNKTPIINALHEGIINTAIKRFLVLGNRETDLLYQFIRGDFNTDKISKDEMDFFLEVYPKAVRMGLLFSFHATYDINTIMPLEISDAIKHFMSEIDKIKKQYFTEISALKQIDDALKAAVHLYGVVSLDRVREIWEIQYPNVEYSADFEDLLFKTVPLLAIKYDYDYIEHSLIADYKFADPEYAEDFYYHVLQKMGNNYYIPTKKEAHYYAEYRFNQHSTSYKKMKQLISKFTNNMDLLLLFIEYSIQIGEPLSSLMQEVQGLDLLHFDKESQFFDFAELHMQLNNNSRLWENAGYTPTELASQSSDEIFNLMDKLSNKDNIIPSTNFQKENDDKKQPRQIEKVGRNDLCPCGSGKKYKKCCWNK